MTVHTKPNKRDVKKSTVVIDKTPSVGATTVGRQATEICEISNLSYRELQAKAKRDGLKASGSKTALIERILSA